MTLTPLMNTATQHELHGREDDRVERALQLAERHGAEYPTSATTVTFTAGVGTASALKLYDARAPRSRRKKAASRAVELITVKAAATTEKFTVPTP